MNNTERILEFDKVKNLWAEFAHTEAAKEKLQKCSPYFLNWS